MTLAKCSGDGWNSCMRLSNASSIWKNTDAVCFDVDSTVCQDEVLDELASYLGVGDQVRSLTQAAMCGTMSFRESLHARLKILQLTHAKLQAFIKQRTPLLTPGIEHLIVKLHERGVHVYLVTGSFMAVIEPIARILKIPQTNIFANILHFNGNGNYTGFDTTQLTSDSGSRQVGKAGVCGLLKETMNYKNLVMIGDGVTDLEASPPADLFIGFGGNQCRERVQKEAAWFVKSFDVLTECLD